MRKVPCVIQEEMLDCGPACLYAIFKYYHGKMRYSKIKKMVPVTNKGCDALSLQKAGEKLGFLVVGKKGEIEQIQQEDYPVIAHLKKESYYHFVVLMDINLPKKTVTIMDPAVGYHKLSLTQFKEMSTGNYLFFKVKRFLQREREQSIWKELFPKVAKKKTIFLAFLGNSALAFFELLSFVEVKLFFNYLWVPKDMYNVIAYFGFFLCFHLLIEGGHFLFHWFFLILQKPLLNNCIQNWMKTLLYLPYYFFENHQVSALLARTESLEELYFFVNQLLEGMFLHIPLILFSFLFLSAQSYFFFLGLLFCLLLFLFDCFLFQRRLEKKADAYLQAKEKRDTLFLEVFEKMDVVKGLHQEKFFLTKWRKLASFFQKKSYQWNLFLEEKKSLKAFERKSMKFLFLLLFLFAFYEKKVVLADFFALEILFELLLSSYTKLVELFFLYPKMKVEAEKLEPYLTACKELFPKKSILPLPRFTTLEVKGFTYHGEGHLKKCAIHFRINAKEKVLLQGPSGCGKSTLCKSLLHYYPIEKGELFLNGIDLCYLHLEDLRSRVCYLSQEEGLFSGSLLENITLGKKVSNDKLQKVLEITHVQKLLKDKEIDLNFPLSLLNLSLSGGERKKILLARCLLLKRDIYLFDEVFESMEEEEVREILKNVLCYLEDAIVLVVSHRKDVEHFFQKIYKFEEGI